MKDIDIQRDLGLEPRSRKVNVKVDQTIREVKDMPTFVAKRLECKYKDDITIMQDSGQITPEIL